MTFSTGPRTENPLNSGYVKLGAIYRLESQTNFDTINPWIKMKLNFINSNPDRIDRIGSGHIGGKARGLSFFHRLYETDALQREFSPHRLQIPQTTVITTEAFERFVDDNQLYDCILERSNQKILERFQTGRFRPVWLEAFQKYLEKHPFPLAIRSSSQNEDALNHPFAGLFLTLLLPNNCSDPKVRLDQLVYAIKAVFASTYFQSPQAYMRKHSLPIEDEKMAVILQQLVGRRYDHYFYPRIAGVAQSINFFPVGPIKPDDGIALAVLGLGKAAVEGDRVMRFCPRFPTIRPQLYSVKDFLRYAQQDFIALDLTTGGKKLTGQETDTLVSLPLSVAEKHHTLQKLVSTWDPRDRTLYDGVFHPGRRVLTFNSILKGGLFPLGRMIDKMLTGFQDGIGSPVDIEYAVELDDAGGYTNGVFYLLQARPLVTRSFRDEVSIPNIESDRVLIRTHHTMGNGKLEKIKYILFVDTPQLDPVNSPRLARVTAEFDGLMRARGEQYILIGPGRWGSTNPRLGVPVTFAQIANAAAILETSAPGLIFEPSQGTHFFHLITAGGIVYMAIVPEEGDWMNRALINTFNSVHEKDNVFLLKPDTPLEVVVDGRSGDGVIYLAREPDEKVFVADWEAGDFD